MKYTLLPFGLIVSVFLSFTPHAQKLKQDPAILHLYSIQPIGPVDLKPKILTRQNVYASLAPKINNRGEVIYNTQSDAVIHDSTERDYQPKLGQANVRFHSINDRGDILVSVNRGPETLQWAIWPEKGQNPQNPRFQIQTGKIDSYRVNFREINLDQTLVGLTNPGGEDLLMIERLTPIQWNRETGLTPSTIGMESFGELRAINSRGDRAGIAREKGHQIPFFITAEGTTYFLRDYLKKIHPQGWTTFGPVVLLDNQVVMGSFGFGNGQYNSYMWLPTKQAFYPLLLDSMRISDANESQVAVGVQDKEAAIRYPAEKPLKLSQLLSKDEADQWKLLEATSINDQGEIVGFGNFQGKLYVFKAVPK